MGRPPLQQISLVFALLLASGCVQSNPGGPGVDDPVAGGMVLADGMVLREANGDCRAAHGAPTTFLDVTASSGIDFSYERGVFPGDPWPHDFGGGLASADFDGDGNPDIYLTNKGGESELWMGQGGMRFTERPEAGGARPGLYVNGASAADLDSDGDPDLVVMLDDDLRIYLNDGQASFSDITPSSGVRQMARPLAVAFADINGDRWLDMFVCTFFSVRNGSGEVEGWDYLFLSDGEGAWIDEPMLAPSQERHSGCFAAGFTDLDEDGQLDLVTVHDKGEYYAPDRFYRRVGDGFSEEAEIRGLSQQHSGMGLAFADFDGDGWTDIWKSSRPNDRLLSSAGDGYFFEASIAAGLGPGADRGGSTWDLESWDFENDGDPDLVALVARYGSEGADQPLEENQFFVNDGSGFFELRVGSDFGVSPGNLNRSLVRADFDGDGGDDLLIPDWNGAHLYQGKCGAGGFLRVSVEGTHCALDAPGTHVEIETPDGQRQERTVMIGGQVQSSESGDVSFGLGENATVSRLLVTFPCGAQVEAFDLPRDRLLHVIEPE